MKAIHWSPAKNKSAILEKGIQIQDTWISATLATPFKNLNRWWLDFLLNDQEYLGFVFELNESDFPLVHDHWVIDTHKEYDDDYEIISKRRYTLKEILNSNPKSVFPSIKQLKKDYKETIICRIGDGTKEGLTLESYEERLSLGKKYIQKSKKKAIKDFIDNPDFMEFTFEDYQLLLFKNIAPERIVKVIKPNTNYQYNELMNEIKESL